MLATMDVPFQADAAEFAVAAAVENGQPLVLLNVVEMFPTLAAIHFKDVDFTSAEDAAALRAPAELAHSLGVRVERVRVSTPHPIDALIETTLERRPGILVFGPDRQRLKPRRYRKAVRAVRERAPCLVWLSD
ncbi:MAG TPA: universal stress protein [Gaiellaceae bacterium]|jgi:nucleotide-binding universal stress UspA family protein